MSPEVVKRGAAAPFTPLKEQLLLPKIDEGDFATIALLDAYADLPNRRTAVQGENTAGEYLYFKHSIARKLYRCPSCQDGIQIGEEHVYVSLLGQSITYDHHHIHTACFQKRLLPALHNVQTIKPDTISNTALNAKARRKRYAQRRGR